MTTIAAFIMWTGMLFTTDMTERWSAYDTFKNLDECHASQLRLDERYKKANLSISTVCLPIGMYPSIPGAK